jgi:hypothetical protein
MIVFLFQSSADALGTASKHSTATDNTVANILNSFIVTPVFSPSSSHGRWWLWERFVLSAHKSSAARKSGSFSTVESVTHR